MAGLSIPLDEVAHFDVVTHDPSTGGRVTATSITFDVFEEATDTAILANQTLTERAGATGVFRGTFTASAANGFELGKYYSIVAEATAGGVVGQAVALSFRIVAAETVAGVLKVDMTHIVGGSVPTPTTTGILDVNVERWLDTLVTLSGTLPDVNVEAMDANSIAAGTIAAGELTNIENEIWNALKSAHVVANSFGDFLDIEVSSRSTFASGGNVNVASMDANSIAAGTIASGELTNIENEIWDALKSAHVVANSFGDFLDIEVSGRLASADINLTAGVLDEVAVLTGHTAQTGDSFARIGAAGASLTDLGGMSTGMKAEVEVEANDALVANNLDHLLLNPVPISFHDSVNVDSVIGHIVQDGTGTGTGGGGFNRETESLEKLRDDVPGAVWTEPTLSELAQGVPATTPSPSAGLMALYMSLRNRLDVDTVAATDFKEIYNDAGTVIFKKALTDDGSIYSEAKAETGP